MAEDNSIINYKFALLGDSSVGKTSIFKKISTGQFFLENIATLGTDKKSIEYNDIEIETNGKTEKKSFLIELFDTAGQERYRSITKNYIKGSDGIILIYDLTNKASFKNINTWLKGISENIDINKTSFVLVGNKCDCDDLRQVSLEEGQNLAQEKGFPFFETSVKNNININQSFVAIINQMIKLGMGKKRNKEIIKNKFILENVNLIFNN